MGVIVCIAFLSCLAFICARQYKLHRGRECAEHDPAERRFGESEYDWFQRVYTDSELEENLHRFYSQGRLGDREKREYIVREMQETFRGSKYWSEFDPFCPSKISHYSPAAETITVATMLANRGKLPKYASSPNNVLYDASSLRVSTILTLKDALSRSSEWFKLIEEILHAQDVPYHWVCVSRSDHGESCFSWGALTGIYSGDKVYRMTYYDWNEAGAPAQDIPIPAPYYTQNPPTGQSDSKDTRRTP